MVSIKKQQKTNLIKILLLVIVFGIISVFPPRLIQAKETDIYAPTLYGLSAALGYTYDPSDNTFFSQISFCAVYDYDRVWMHRAPKALRFKVEGSAGLSYLEGGDTRLISNANIFALYYLKFWQETNIKPYVEAGIGLIYTDYTVDGQAYRLNFNPQAGFGIEIKRKSGTTNFLALRVHHLSNGGIDSDNRGQNSLVIMVGQYF